MTYLTNGVKLLIFVPPAAFILWFLVQYAQRGGPLWPQNTKHKSVYIPARLWTILYLAAWVVYYILYLLDIKDTYPKSAELSMARAGTWNCLLCIALGGAAHLSVDKHSLWPVALMMLVLPFATPDRFPFTVESQGCPNSFHHVVASVALVSAFVLLYSRDLQISISPEAYRGWRPVPSLQELEVHGEQVPNTVIAYFEILPLICATLSISYLFCCLVWVLIGHSTTADVVYHHVDQRQRLQPTLKGSTNVPPAMHPAPPVP